MYIEVYTPRVFLVFIPGYSNVYKATGACMRKVEEKIIICNTVLKIKGGLNAV